MAVSLSDFWKLAVDSRLLTGEQCRQLSAGFQDVKGALQSSTLAEWLISRNVLTRYEATVLLAGRAGPFFYGDYRVFDHVSSGPPAGTFRAVHVPTGHPVMLQFLSGSATQEAALAATLRAAEDIRHPHLQRLHTLADTGAYRFLVFEDLAGRTLDQQLAAHRRLPPAEACRIVRCAAIALAHLHQHQTVHGDLRPAQLWLDGNGHVKVVRDPAGGPTPVPWTQPELAACLVARADYAAPELAQPGRRPDAASDLYALGCTLYHLLSGQPPFPGGDLAQKLSRHAAQPIPALEPFGVPTAVAQIVNGLLAKNPTVRPPHAAHVISQLTPLVAPAQWNTRPPLPPPTLAAWEQALRQRRAETTGPPAPLLSTTPAAKTSTDQDARAAAGTIPVAMPSDSAHGRHGQRSSNVNAAILVTVAAGVLLLLMLAVTLWLVGDRRASRVRSPGGAGPAEQTQAGSGSQLPDGAAPAAADATDRQLQIASAVARRYHLVADNGSWPWAPPTAGKPVSLQYVPPGAQFYLIVRPAELLANVQGNRAQRALGPVFTEHLAQWESAAGLALGDVEQLILSLHHDSGSASRASLVVRLKEPVDRATLRQKWGLPTATGSGGATYYAAASGWAYLFPAGAPDGVFVMGAPAQVKDVIEFRGAAPTLPPALSELLGASDDQRHCTLLFASNDLLANVLRDGGPPAPYASQSLREALSWVLGDGVEAGMLSLHCADHGYVELMLAGPANRRKGTAAAEFRDRLRELPDRVDRYVASLKPDPYWEAVAQRFPAMVRYSASQSRVGSENGLTVANAVLPPAAIHNLLFAAELALATAAQEGRRELP
jgi:serine/threonine-protein kinase